MCTIEGCDRKAEAIGQRPDGSIARVCHHCLCELMALHGWTFYAIIGEKDEFGSGIDR